VDELDYYETLEDFRNDLLTTKQAAHLADVVPQTIRMWVNRGHLKVAVYNGVEVRDKQDRPRYWRLDVAKAEHATRKRARRYVAHAA
jgi:predicted site-specific integrase-resolvase